MKLKQNQPHSGFLTKLNGVVNGISSDPLFTKWHDRFTMVRFKSLLRRFLYKFS